MGRGRAKAKQTKVARELKYSGGGTDLDALRKELTSRAPAPREAAESGSTDGIEDDDQAEDDADQDDESDLDDDLDGRYGASGRR
jgi:hypothetical protein